MSTSLYQKYRPQLFADMVGQDHIRTTLLNELKANDVSHAYLFSGSRGIGKTTTARIVARAVNCLNPKEGEPCNACEYCLLILGGRALDVIEIDAASHTGVDHVRENIIENARVAPTKLPWKVFIIDEVHMLSTSAFNALLKTLEEPPQKTMFILATTELHKVPATIISRCEQFQFRRASYEHLVLRLADLAKREGVMVDQEVLEAIARRAEGALRDAESLLGQVLTLDETHVTTEMAEIILPTSGTAEMIGFFEELIRKETALSIARVNRLIEEGMILPEFTKEFIEFLRCIMLYRVQESIVPLQRLNVNADQLRQLSTLTEQTRPQQLAHMIEVFLQASEQDRTASIPQLPLELAIIRLSETPVQPLGVKFVAETSQKPVATPPESLQKKKASLEESADAPVEENAVLTIDDVRTQWGMVLEEMKRANHGLHLSLQVGKLVSVDGSVITLGFQYQFYQDRLHDARNRPVIDGVLQSVFGRKVILETVVGKEYAKKSPTDVANIEQPSEEEVANVWDLAAKSFGQPS